MENKIKAFPLGNTPLREKFRKELNKKLAELATYYGDELDRFAADCDAALGGEVGITGSAKQLDWAKAQIAAFEEIAAKQRGAK